MNAMCGINRHEGSQPCMTRAVGAGLWDVWSSRAFPGALPQARMKRAFGPKHSCPCLPGPVITVSPLLPHSSTDALAAKGRIHPSPGQRPGYAAPRHFIFRPAPNARVIRVVPSCASPMVTSPSHASAAPLATAANGRIHPSPGRNPGFRAPRHFIFRPAPTARVIRPTPDLLPA